jgi:sugar lactone lactonase YvrE
MASSLIIRPLTELKAVTGESPLWSHSEQALYWVDIKNPRVFRHKQSEALPRSWPMPSEIGAICHADSGRFVVSLRSGVMLFDPQSGELEPIEHPEASRPGYRLNETKIDRRGRLWVGSVEDPGFSPEGRLYRLTGRSLSVMQENISMPNALGWSPDSRTMYFSDSFQRRIWSFDYDLDEGVISNKRDFVEIPEGEGFPDGLAVDCEGFVWNAQMDGWCLKRYDPTGRIDRVIDLPVRRPTSLAFGGPNYDTLFVTTATLRLSQDELETQPLAGCVLMLSPGVRGQPEPTFVLAHNED